LNILEDDAGLIWKNIGMSLGWNHAWTNQFKNASIVSYSNHAVNDNYSWSLDSLGIITADDYSQGSDLKTTALKVTNEVSINRMNTLRFGMEFEDNKASINTTRSLIFFITKFSAWQLCGFLQDQFNPIKWLTFIPGIRCTYYSGGTNDNWFWDFRLNMLARCTDAFLLKGSVGTYHQFILQASSALKNGFYTGYNPFWVPADNKGLPVTDAFQAILGGMWSTKRYSFDIEGYYKWINGFSGTPVIINGGMLEPVGGSTSLGGKDLVDYKGNGLIYGIDFLASINIGVYTGWIGYTLSKSLERNLSINSDDWYPAPDDRRHEIKYSNLS
jgi:hypothetical protein